MAIHWQVKFKSLRVGELYTVSIYDDNYYGNPIQLKGAAQPFVTQEDSTDDMFTPVLTQSGYLRIVDTGKDGAGNTFNWRDFIPTTDTDRPVTLTNGNGETVWMGFLQAQNFGSVMFEMPQEREFPVQCPLAVSSRADISMANKEIHNFAYLLLEIVDNIPYVCRPNTFYFQGLNSTDYLQKEIDWQNFAQVDGAVVKGKYDLLSLLQAMCKFWGWTARMYHDSMFFVSPDVNDNYFVKVRYRDLRDIAYENTFYAENVSYTNIIFGNDIFASTSNTDYQMRGPNTAKITANSGDVDSPIVSLYPDNVLEQMEAGSSYQEQYGSKRAKFSDDLDEFDSPLLVGSCAASTESFNIMDIVEGSGFVPQGVTKTTFNTIRIRQTYNGNALVSLETVFEHTFNGLQALFSTGYILITGDIYRQGERYEYADETTGAGKSHLHINVGIGSSRSTATWLNGSADIGGTRRQGFLWAFPATSPVLRGRLFIDILGSDDMRHEASTGYIDRMEIVDFQVTFSRANDQKDSSHEYLAHNDNMVKEERTDETIFATDIKLEYGYALVMNPDGTMFKGIDYNGNNTLIPPEQRLADRIVDYWAFSKRKMEVELRADKDMQTGTYSTDVIVNLSPGMKATLDGTGVYPISISHNWRDDIVNVTLLEL